MDTNLYWILRGPFDEKRNLLMKADRACLENAIIDTQYNSFLSNRSDYSEKDEDRHGHGKRLPYIGWFWRHLNFSSGCLPIGDCGEFIGFIPNNKWDHPERLTTKEEFNTIMAFIDRAMAEDQKGGEVSKIIENTNKALDDLWDYLQTLDVQESGG